MSATDALGMRAAVRSQYATPAGSGVKGSRRNRAFEPREYEPRAVRAGADLGGQRTATAPISARTGPSPRARDRVLERPTTTGAGGGGEDFLSRQKKREELRAARLEARRQEIDHEQRSQPLAAPVLAGGRPISRGSSRARRADGPLPGGGQLGEGGGGRRGGSGGSGSAGGVRQLRAARVRSRNSRSNSRSNSRGGSGSGESSLAPPLVPKAKRSAGKNSGPVHPQSAAAKEQRAKAAGLKAATAALAILRSYAKHDLSQRSQAAFEEFVAALPPDFTAGEPSKPKKKLRIHGETVANALGALAGYVQENEDTGSAEFRKLGSCLPFAAAAADDPDLLEYLASAGIDLSAGRSGDGVTPMIVAAAKSKMSSLAALLKLAPESVRRCDANGYSPLLMAAEEGVWQVGHQLLSHRGSAADPDHALPDGTTALIIACESGEAQFVELMIEAGATLDAALTDGTTALFMAAQESHADVMCLLLNACDAQVLSAFVNRSRHDGFTPLMIAAGEGAWPCCELLIKGQVINPLPTALPFLLVHAK